MKYYILFFFFLEFFLRFGGGNAKRIDFETDVPALQLWLSHTLALDPRQ